MPTSSPGKRVVAFDPGEQVGIATASIFPDRKLGAVARYILDWNKALDWFAAAQNVGDVDPMLRDSEEASRPPTFDVVVFETWLPRPVNGSMAWIQGDPLISAQFIGAMKWIARTSGAKLKGYGPDRKHVWEGWVPTILPTLGPEVGRHDDNHDRDAILHLVGYYAENWWEGPDDG